MKIQVFHVGDGDCLLLTAADRHGVDHRILVDGGRKQMFRDNARDVVYGAGPLRLVCVSHIDDDHISGIVALMEDIVAWRVHKHLKLTNRRTSEPPFPEPPEIKEIWHNALFELVGDDLEPEIPGALSAVAGILAGSPDPDQQELAASLDNLATGEESAMELSRRISPEQLNIKTNRPRGQLMKLGNAERRTVGPFVVREIGPTQESLDELRKVWKKWLAANKKAMRELQAEMLRDEERMGLGASTPLSPEDLAASLGAGTITAPNVASLMLLVEDSTTKGRILLTGDGASEDILSGLDAQRQLDAQRSIHVEALKVQHHGALANVTQEFVDRVTADQYLFCGNGAHHNPEREVVEAFARSRLGVGGVPPVGPVRPFRFVFSSRHDSPGLKADRVAHMRMIEDLVATIKRDHDPNNRFAFEFLRAGHLEVTI